MSLHVHRGLVLDPMSTVATGEPVFVCVGEYGCGCLVLDVEQHADWHLRYARPPVIATVAGNGKPRPPSSR